MGLSDLLRRKLSRRSAIKRTALAGAAFAVGAKEHGTGLGVAATEKIEAATEIVESPVPSFHGFTWDDAEPIRAAQWSISSGPGHRYSGRGAYIYMSHSPAWTGLRADPITQAEWDDYAAAVREENQAGIAKRDRRNARRRELYAQRKVADLQGDWFTYFEKREAERARVIREGGDPSWVN